jgi:hypothetical protein
MLIFPRFYVTNPSNMNRNHPNQIKNNTIVTQNKVFGSIKDSLINLLILVTTSNNPDVMIQIYSQSRLAALYFIVYVLIGNFFESSLSSIDQILKLLSILGLYLIMSLVTAVIYNQFRGFFKVEKFI